MLQKLDKYENRDCTRAARAGSRWRSAALFAVLFVAGCGGGSGDEAGYLRLQLIEDGVDTTPADTLYLRVTQAPSTTPFFEQTFALDGSIKLDEATLAGPQRVFYVEMRTGVTVVAQGDAGPYDVNASQQATVLLILRSP